MQNEIEKNNEETLNPLENLHENNVPEEQIKEEKSERHVIENNNNNEVLNEILNDSPESTEPFIENLNQENTEQKLVYLELNKLTNLFNDLLNDFNIKLKYDKHKETIIDKLHAENQILKDNLYKKIMMPIVNNLILLIDDYTKLTNEYNNKISEESDTYKQLLKHFGNVVEDLINVLTNIGVDELVTTNDKLDATKQKVIKIENTEDPLLDKTIFNKIKKGFIFEDKIVRPEMVSCYKYIN